MTLFSSLFCLQYWQRSVCFILKYLFYEVNTVEEVLFNNIYTSVLLQYCSSTVEEVNILLDQNVNYSLFWFLHCGKAYTHIATNIKFKNQPIALSMCQESRVSPWYVIFDSELICRMKTRMCASRIFCSCIIVSNRQLLLYRRFKEFCTRHCYIKRHIKRILLFPTKQKRSECEINLR